jgi:hypothetical protein
MVFGFSTVRTLARTAPYLHGGSSTIFETAGTEHPIATPVRPAGPHP